MRATPPPEYGAPSPGRASGPTARPTVAQPASQPASPAAPPAANGDSDPPSGADRRHGGPGAAPTGIAPPAARTASGTGAAGETTLFAPLRAPALDERLEADATPLEAPEPGTSLCAHFSLRFMDEKEATTVDEMSFAALADARTRLEAKLNGLSPSFPAFDIGPEDIRMAEVLIRTLRFLVRFALKANPDDLRWLMRDHFAMAPVPYLGLPSRARGSALAALLQCHVDYQREGKPRVFYDFLDKAYRMEMQIRQLRKLPDRVSAPYDAQLEAMLTWLLRPADGGAALDRDNPRQRALLESFEALHEETLQHMS